MSLSAQYFLFLVHFPAWPCFCYVYVLSCHFRRYCRWMCTFLFLRDQASTVANYDVYEMLFILRVFIWINFVSSLCVVISRFTVFFFDFLMASTVASWWKKSNVGVFLCLDVCDCILIGGLIFRLSSDLRDITGCGFPPRTLYYLHCTFHSVLCFSPLENQLSVGFIVQFINFSHLSNTMYVFPRHIFLLLKSSSLFLLLYFLCRSFKYSWQSK